MQLERIFLNDASVGFQNLSMDRQQKPLEAFLNEKFRENRERGGLRTPADFARRTGITEGAISRWRKGSPPDFVQCLRIASYFKVDARSVIEMVGGDKAEDWLPLYDEFSGRVIRKQDEVNFESEVERDIVLKLLDVLREDPGGTGKAVTDNVIEFSLAVKLKKQAGLLPAKKETSSRKKRRAS